MKKFLDKFWAVLPIVWGALWVAIITVGSSALLVAVFKWLFSTLGVI